MDDLKKWLKNPETHRKSSCLVLTFIGHGDERGWLMDKDEGPAWYLESLVRELSIVETLEGKPKLLVMQSCRRREYLLYWA